jgi:hypothetical protein
MYNEKHLRLLGSLERWFSGDEQEVGVRWQPVRDLVHKSKKLVVNVSTETEDTGKDFKLRSLSR